jgi:hypothetical protein
MSTINKMLYGASGQSITCTITGLTNNSQQGSTALDNTSSLFLDALVFVKVRTASAATSATGTLNIYAYGTADGGTTYSDGVSGVNGGVSLTVPPNVRLIGVINCVANSTTYNGGPFSVALAFGGMLPDHWGIIVENKTGATLDATTGSAWYQGIQTQGV